MVAVETSAGRDVAKKGQVPAGGSRQQRAGAFGEVCAQCALAPRLRARLFHWQPLIPSVQVVDHIIIVVVLVVVQVGILEKFGPVIVNNPFKFVLPRQRVEISIL